MDIRVVSSLTPEDEERVAPSVLAVLRRILDRLPIAYTIRVEATSQRVFQHTAAADPVLPKGKAREMVS